MISLSKKWKSTSRICQSTIEKISPEKYIPALLESLNDSDYTVRFTAANSLRRVNGKSPELVIPALVNRLRDPFPAVRQFAILALGEYGPQAKTAVPSLLEMQDDPESRIRDEAGKAIKLIDREAPGKRDVGPTTQNPSLN